MSEKTKAAISYFLSAASFAALGVDKLTTVDLSNTISIISLIVGSIAGAFGIFWTAPKGSK